MNEEIRIVTDMTLLLLVSGICSIVFAKIKMPPILGYLATGIILGPTMFRIRAARSSPENDLI